MSVAAAGALKESNKARTCDPVLCVLSIALTLVGLFFVFDASYPRAADSARIGHDALYFAKRQALASILGMSALYLCLWIKPKALRLCAIPALGIGLALVVLTHTHGVELGGAKRSLDLGGFTLSPSELMKVALALFLAWYLAAVQTSIRKNPWAFWTPAGIVFLSCGAVALQPDLGTSLVLFGIGFLMLWVAGAAPKQLGMMLLVAALCAGGLVAKEPWRIGRLDGWTDPWKHYDNPQNYQAAHSLLALGSGGLTGIGVCNSVQKRYYLPVAFTDFILAVIGEETGFIGATLVLFLLCAFVWRALAIAMALEEPFEKLLGVGLALGVGLCGMLNAAVVTGLVPVTGVPLPFISFGGSSLVFTLATVGILLKLSIRVPPRALDLAEGD
jgi:cell division protein FtsW